MRLLIAFALVLVASACEQKDSSRPPPPPTAPTTPAAAPTKVPPDANHLPAACGEFRRIMRRLAECEKLEGTVRKSMQDAFAQLESVWTTFETMPAATVETLNTTCNSSLEALRQAADSICPEIFKVEAETP